MCCDAERPKHDGEGADLSKKHFMTFTYLHPQWKIMPRNAGLRIQPFFFFAHWDFILLLTTFPIYWLCWLWDCVTLWSARIFLAWSQISFVYIKRSTVRIQVSHINAYICIEFACSSMDCKTIKVNTACTFFSHRQNMNLKAVPIWWLL